MGEEHRLEKELRQCLTENTNDHHRIGKLCKKLIDGFGWGNKRIVNRLQKWGYNEQ